MATRRSIAGITVLTLLALVVGAGALGDRPTGKASPSAESPGNGLVQLKDDADRLVAQATSVSASEQSSPPGEAPSASVFVVLALFAADLVLCYYLAARHSREDAVVAVLGITLVAAAALVFAMTDFGGASRAVPPLSDGAGSGLLDPAASAASERTVLLVALGALSLAAPLAALALRGTGTESWTPTGDDGEGTADDTRETHGEVAAVAGHAADRIADDAPPDNAVYQAWREMTDALDVPDPETSTPGEFQAAAVDAGMDSEDVAVLTDLFETVRYGDQTATEERERRAQQALRNVERTYGGAS
ncbi:DUF4129 domain-containing protein [Haloarcula limicola]|nr:DUF4129 domain-containing protein [Halomicroarcula limicola]